MNTIILWIKWFLTSQANERQEFIVMSTNQFEVDSYHAMPSNGIAYDSEHHTKVQLAFDMTLIHTQLEMVWRMILKIHNKSIRVQFDTSKPHNEATELRAMEAPEWHGAKCLTQFKGTFTNSSSFASQREQFFFLWFETSRSLPEVEVPGDQRLVRIRLSCWLVEWADTAEDCLLLLECSNELKPWKAHERPVSGWWYGVVLNHWMWWHSSDSAWRRRGR